MYVEDQGSFINGVCEVNEAQVDINNLRKLSDRMQVQLSRDDSPSQLLAKLKAIENKMGRVKTVDKGPRNIDLDILLHDGTVMDTPDLSVPHKAMLEREFVLRPLCE